MPYHKHSDLYGKSPAMQELDSLKAWNALPADERAAAAARWVEQHLIDQPVWEIEMQTDETIYGSMPHHMR